MYDPGLEFEQKVLVFRIVFRQFHIIPGKIPDHIQVFPERHGDKVSDLAFLALQDVDVDIARNRLIVGNGSLVQEGPLSLSFAGGHTPMPHTYNHVASFGAGDRYYNGLGKERIFLLETIRSFLHSL